MIHNFLIRLWPNDALIYNLHCVKSEKNPQTLVHVSNEKMMEYADMYLKNPESVGSFLISDTQILKPCKKVKSSTTSISGYNIHNCCQFDAKISSLV